MVVVGITGRRRGAAAAVAVDGTVVAAVSEAMMTRVPAAGYREHGFPVASVRACLERAGFGAAAVELVISADGSRHESARAPTCIVRGARAAGFDRAVVHQIGTLEAYARQAAIAVGCGVVLTTDLQQRAAALARLDERGVSFVRPLPGLATLLGLTCRLGRALGLSVDEPADILQALELLARSISHESIPWFGNTIDVRAIDDSPSDTAFDAVLARAGEEAGGSLADVSSPHVGVHRVRASVADGFLRMLATAMARALAAGAKELSVDKAAVAGSAFLSPDFNARLRALAAMEVAVAPASAPEGAALGAALQPFAPGSAPGLPNLALGPSFTETDTKVALENCRLDYVYEPAWPRLLERISRVLARGKLVAWSQEAAEFGPPLVGSRSVLADPSNRYVRDNVNRFLRRRPDEWPLCVSIPAAASDCLVPGTLSPWQFTQATVLPNWQDRLVGAVDRLGSVHAHVLQTSNDGPFHSLLALHWQRTGVPGLVNIALQGVGEPVACSPRDAIRATFSSAVDAMVIHRFLVMKDYWQLRTGEA
jgi:predicted NodU family carbamoyl transferase